MKTAGSVVDPAVLVATGRTFPVHQRYESYTSSSDMTSTQLTGSDFPADFILLASEFDRPKHVVSVTDNAKTDTWSIFGGQTELDVSALKKQDKASATVFAVWVGFGSFGHEGGQTRISSAETSVALSIGDLFGCWRGEGFAGHM